MLRGRDPSELEADLAKVERRLSEDGAFSPQERNLRRLYYTHLRDTLQLFLARPKCARKETGEQVNTGSSVSTESNVEGTEAPSLSQVKPSDESWKVITPLALIHAVTNVRKDFEELSDSQSRYFQKRCFDDLHPLAAGLTEPATFRKHFYACVGALCKILPHTFGRLLDLSLNQNGMIGEAPIEWAALQVTDLIECEDRLVNRWIKDACDRQGYVASATTEDFVFWTDWRAPKWLYMRPNGHLPYDASTAWERMDEAETRRALSALRENRWIFSLESTLGNLVGSAHEVLAKRKNHPTPGSLQRPQEPVPPSAATSNRPLGAKITTYQGRRRINSVAADFDNFAGRLMYLAHQKLKNNGLSGHRHRRATPDLPSSDFLKIVRKVDKAKVRNQAKFPLRKVLTKNLWNAIAYENQRAGPAGKKIITIAEAAVHPLFKRKIHRRFNRAEIFYREHCVQKQS